MLQSLRPYLLASLAYLSWSVGDVAIKFAGIEIPPAQILFFSALFALPLIATICITSGQKLVSLKIEKYNFLFALIVFQILTSLTSIIAVTRIPLSNFYILFFSSALISPILARLFLKEQTSLSIIIAIITGFIGCFWAVGGIDRTTTNSVITIGIIAGMACAISYALAEVTTRKANFSETDISMIFWPSIGYLILCGGYLLFYSSTAISISAIPYMALNGFSWVLGWWLLIKALKQTIVGDLSGFQFLLLPYGMIFDFFIWGQHPNHNLLIGSAVILASMSFLIWKKRKTTP